MDEKTAISLIEYDYDTEHWEPVTNEAPYSTTRWSVLYDQVWKDVINEKYWKISWSRGATEYQDNGVENVYFYEVKPVSETVIVYKAVQQ